MLMYTFYVENLLIRNKRTFVHFSSTKNIPGQFALSLINNEFKKMIIKDNDKICSKMRLKMEQ